MNLPHIREQFYRDHEWPFTHENKWMAVKCIPKYNPVCFIINFIFIFKLFFYYRMNHVYI
jgi:hypothetical protein